MSNFEQRLQTDLDAIRNRIFNLGSTVHQSLSDSIASLLSQDSELAYATILGDHPVNREVDTLNLSCHRFIAKYLPSAGHLRFVSSSLRTIILLERLGDYAATISRESVHLERAVEGSFKREVQVMAYDALEMLAKALSAYQEQNTESAKATMGDARIVDRDFLTAYADLIGPDKENLSTKDLFARLVIINQIERVSDQAKNLCEEVVFARTGETKQRRPYRLLFLDKHDDSVTQIAVALCRKFHADRVVANSAGHSPHAVIRESTRLLCEERGLDMSGLDPSGISNWASADWKTHDVLVTLNSDIGDYAESVPFGTSVLRWDVSAKKEEEEFSLLSEQVDNLVHLVRGPAKDDRSS